MIDTAFEEMASNHVLKFKLTVEEKADLLIHDLCKQEFPINFAGSITDALELFEEAGLSIKYDDVVTGWQLVSFIIENSGLPEKYRLDKDDYL